MDWNNVELKIPLILGLNLALSLITVFLHTCASSVSHHVTHAMISRIRRVPSIFDETLMITTIVSLLSMFHLFEVFVWGFAFLWLGAVSDASDAFYISLTNYTTLGPDGVTFDQRFRALAGFESLVGPLMIAWSTAIIATVLNHIAALRAAQDQKQK